MTVVLLKSPVKFVQKVDEKEENPLTKFEIPSEYEQISRGLYLICQ